MKFGGIGVPELIIILVVALLIFGPKNLPKLGSALGKTVKNVREGMNSTDKEPEAEEVEEEVEEADEEEVPKPAAKKKAAPTTKKKPVDGGEEE
jgi:sec-independent protein translocase protein TatA